MCKWCGSSRPIILMSRTTISRLGVVQCLPVQGRYDCDIRRSQYLVEPVSGGRQTWCRVSCLTMPIIHNDDAAPCISRTGTMVWSVAQYASPPPPQPPPRHVLMSIFWHRLTSTNNRQLYIWLLRPAATVLFSRPCSQHGMVWSATFVLFEY